MAPKLARWSGRLWRKSTNSNKLKSGGLHEKLGIWEASQRLLEDRVKTKKKCVEVAVSTALYIHTPQHRTRYGFTPEYWCFSSQHYWRCTLWVLSIDSTWAAAGKGFCAQLVDADSLLLRHALLIATSKLIRPVLWPCGLRRTSAATC